MAAPIVTLNDLERYLSIAGLFKCNPSNICAAFYTISTDRVLARFLCTSRASCSTCYYVYLLTFLCWAWHAAFKICDSHCQNRKIVNYFINLENSLKFSERPLFCVSAALWERAKTIQRFRKAICCFAFRASINSSANFSRLQTFTYKNQTHLKARILSQARWKQRRAVHT